MSAPPVVFLAHASEDKVLVRDLFRLLEGAGARPWPDENNLLPGQDWQLEISNALAKANFVIACISANSLTKDGFVQRELREALHLQSHKPPGTIYLIPVILDGSEVPDLRLPQFGIHLRNIQWLDLREPDALARLLRSIGCDVTPAGASAPMIDVQFHSPASWPLEKSCPECDGVLFLNHDLQEYGCRSCDYWEFGP